jgi:hypothetical protein
MLVDRLTRGSNRFLSAGKGWLDIQVYLFSTFKYRRQRSHNHFRILQCKIILGNRGYFRCEIGLLQRDS